MKYKFDSTKITDDNYRHKLSLIVLSIVAFTISFIVSILNLISNYNELGIVTFIIAVTSLINLFFVTNNGKLEISDGIFFFTWTFFILYFLYSKTSNGFSILWTLTIPYSILVLNRKNGTIFSIFILLLLMITFWTPFGRNLLNYNYTSIFLQRFPILYICNFSLVFTYEIIRSATNSELINTKEYYHQLMNKDELTKLPNRKLLNSKFNSLLESPVTNQSSLMIIDIDDFKKINDNYSHLDGDKVLKELANLLYKTIPTTSFLCRWGGEEFVVFMEFNNKDEARLLAENIKDKISNKKFYSIDKFLLKVTVSIGVTSFNSSIIKSQDRIFAFADEALYKAKRNGKNTVVYIETN